MTREEAKLYIIRHCNPDYPKGKTEWERAVNMAIKALEQPEIIRCKDCRHYNAGFECLIEGYGIERNKDWFCGDAERRTDEQNT